MKNLIKISILSLLFLMTACQIGPKQKAQVISSKVIYGEDNRIDTYKLDGGFWHEKVRAVAMKVRHRRMKKQSNGMIRLIGARLKKSKMMCDDEKFVGQRLNAECSGFLIGDDLLATAGHCVKDEFDCKNFSWVFDYDLKGPEDKKYHIIPEKNFYKCKKIISSVYKKHKDLDFAIIQLDKKVTDRTPLTLRKKDKIKTGTKLTIIGHPSGLPKKFANGAEVIKNSNNIFFKANLDSFQINSGSPVFNEETGIVEGILVRGDTDYHWAYQDKCNRVNTIKWDCKERDCRLEDVTRITALPKSLL